MLTDRGRARSRSEHRVDEWGDGRALRQDEQAPENRHDNEDGQQPVFLTDSQKTPKLAEEGSDHGSILVLEGFGSGAWRIAMYPVALCIGLQPQPQPVLAERRSKGHAGKDRCERKPQGPVAAIIIGTERPDRGKNTGKHEPKAAVGSRL